MNWRIEKLYGSGAIAEPSADARNKMPVCYASAGLKAA